MTWSLLQYHAYRSGIGITEFWQVTISEIFLKIHAHSRSEEDRMKTRMIENRMWVATLLAPYNEKKVSAEELIPFSWEVKAKQEIMNTPERKAESKRRIDHWDKIIAQQQ